MPAKILNYAGASSRYYVKRRPMPRWMPPVNSINLAAGIICLFGTCSSQSWDRLGWVVMLDPIVFFSQTLIACVAIGFVLPGQRTPWKLLVLGPAITFGSFVFGLLLNSPPRFSNL